METNRHHIDGETSEDSCPCCAWDERNRPLHGLGRRVKPEPAPEHKPASRQVRHFMGVAS